MAGYIPKGGSWQAEVFSRVDELHGRLAAAEGAKEHPTNEQKAIFAGVTESLEIATKAASGTRYRSRLKAWWSGSTITESWEAVHHAEQALVKVEAPADVKTILPRLLSWIELAMEDRNRRDRHEKALKAQMEGTTFDSIPIRSAFGDVIAANRERYANLRAFRNTLILVTILLALLVIVAAGWHALNSNFLTLCPSGAEACPSGPPKAEVTLIALLGALGGSLALAFGLTETDSAPSRYDPKVWQAFLKPVTGAVTGLLGVILVQAEFLIPPAGNKEYSLLVYAVLFGFSQQLFTRVVDKKAEALTSPAKEE